MKSPANKKPMPASKALLQLSALCAASEQCEADLRTKMRRWMVSEPDADSVISQLRDQHFISDERYARAFVHDKFAFNGWGPRKIAFQLAQKGIGKATIQAVLAETPAEAWAQKLEELLRAKAREVANRPPQLARAALLRFAASRGFDADVTYRTLDQIL